MSYIIPFEDLRMSDIDSVGGKNASLGEMISQLSCAGVRVPSGFATTAQAFSDFLKQSNLDNRINECLSNLDADNLKELTSAGAKIRQWIIDTPFPKKFEKEIRDAFAQLNSNNNYSFAVRSSATAEDLPDASFAGQQETFLNVIGIDDILNKIKHVFASLYNDRAISYRIHKGYSGTQVYLSAGIQRMVRSDIGSAGVMFTIDTESGFKDVVFITSSYGLGETVVQGAVNPDEFYVFKPTLAVGKDSIISRRIGSKLIKMEFDQNSNGVKTIDVNVSDRNKYSLTDKEIIELAKYAVIIENHYGRPMDIEWGKDGLDGKLYILQARPETVKSQQVENNSQLRYRLKTNDKNLLITGRAIGQKIGSGKVKIIHEVSEINLVEDGDILVTDMTDPNWEPIMKKASAIVTNRGGRTCHAAIIARELGIPAVVGCGNATEILSTKEIVTVSCAEGDEGRIYDGLLETHIEEVHRGVMPDINVKIMMNVGNPHLAFEFSQLPNNGVGLARLEFIINNNIGIHPKAILDYPNLDSTLKKAIESSSRGYSNPKDFYIKKIVEGVSTIAAAFWPKPVIVRLSDFKSNEYKKLVGGSRYEPDEENPMLGYRGVSRYISKDFEDCFSMECEAIRTVRNNMGLSNVEIMIPFVRTIDNAKHVINLLEKNGLTRGKDGLKIIMMCELPSNALLADQFLEFFDGFSIGSNDMTQLTLGLDRDSGIAELVADFDERNDAVKMLLHLAIKACVDKKKYIGICGQGPSDHIDFAKWLLNQGITSISLNPDTVIDTWKMLHNH
ncbi:Phosphoenolpyruvate synthase [Candidatus Kinetoplastibacterium sorsogonicusi]|uniref:Phosphoenolpyruvate synthase n=1 Tax=Candidatus Kinetoplastidibacterium kentomonadis TaxID=1576550 RepID=A0A3Q8F6J6_9PROT|nr:phosphoenolpyruvate synthase [Candidatus Kinetoplastibacterium sorsogonicusi]AWD32436.1 Phosphoenolpyruvate synthase [Candidatus Kinetoplastibacterium sorsogonicusi]